MGLGLHYGLPQLPFVGLCLGQLGLELLYAQLRFGIGLLLYARQLDGLLLQSDVLRHHGQLAV